MSPEDHNTEDQSLDKPASNLHGPKLHPMMSPTAAALFGLVGVFILYQFVGGILTVSIFGMDLSNADINALRFLTMGSQILFILFPALLLAKLVYEDVTTVIRFKFPDTKELILFSVGIILLIPIMQNYLYIQNYFIEQWANNSVLIHNIKTLLDKLDKLVEDTYGQLLNANNSAEGLLIIVVVAVTPAICEEIFFRGFVQKSFEQKLRPFWAVFLTALFFGLYHFNPYGLIPLIALGAYLGYAAYSTESIFIPMTLHFLNNLTAVVAYFIWGNEDVFKSNVLPSSGLTISVISFLTLSVLFVGLIYYIRKNRVELSNYQKGKI